MSPDNPVWYFLVASVTSFIATLPFGPINLTVIKTTVDHHVGGALKVSIAAAAVETGQALLAIWFGVVISRFITDHASVYFIVGAIFLALAIYVWIHETHPVLNGSDETEPSFIKRGLFIALINPQAIPFWIFAVTLTSSSLGFNYIGELLFAYLAGVWFGKVLALYGFVLASDYLKTHLDEGSRIVNHLLALVLAIIACLQFVRGFNNW